MTIDMATRYNTSLDEVVGVEDIGGQNGRSNLAANQLFVLMLRGVFQKWKQPIGYVLLSHNLEQSKLHTMIEDALGRLHDIGIRVSSYLNFIGHANM